MTDRLSALLHEEAERLDVPMPAARETITAGRRLRRRRRLTQTAAVVAARGLHRDGRGAARRRATARGRRRRRTPDRPSPRARASRRLGRSSRSGNTVYLHGGAISARMDEVAQTLYYTSAGLLVRTNKDGASDGGAPFHFALVSPRRQAPSKSWG